MDLLALAKRDMERFSRGEFSVACTVKSPTGITVQSRAWGSSHFLSVDASGMPINAKNVHITIGEISLTEQGYKTRNGKGEVDLIGHQISFKNSAGLMRDYIINETYPDETLGMIVCILGDYE